MDLEERARRQNRRVIISEIIMVVAVIVTAGILALVVSGYWLNADFEVERQGMLQISSVPTGANVEVDGESSWLQRTNTSKVVASGEHTIVLTKDGYDSWSKTVNVNEGLLYRLHYPRLFLLDRTAEDVYDASTTTMASVSPDRKSALLINNTTTWTLLNLDSDNPEAKPLDISKVFTTVSLTADEATGLFTGVIKSVNWAQDNEHILFEVESDTSHEWVILNVKNTNDNVNLTHEFAADFTEVKILNNSASSLLVVLNGNLHRIDVSNRQLSAILVEKVEYFDHLDSTVVFSATLTDNLKNQVDDNTNSFYVGILKLGENKITVLKSTQAATKPVISKFYDEEYITVLQENTVTLYKKQDFVKVLESTLSFIPTNIKVGHDGEFITMYTNGLSIATLDMEATTVREWTTGTTDFGWIDNDMIYTVNDGNLKVFDFDGFNERSLSTNVSSHFPATITNNKWLYYFSDGYLVREVISN